MQHGTSYSSTHSFKTLHFLFESRAQYNKNENDHLILSVVLPYTIDADALAQRYSDEL